MRGLISLVGACALGLSVVSTAHAEAMHDWWDSAWWARGELVVPENHTVTVTRGNYETSDVDVPVMIARPDDGEKYPAVLFVHGRRGLDELIEPHVIRLAARGFVVVAPDLYTGRFIEKFPIEHDYVLEEDLSHGLDYLLARDDLSSDKACIYSHTRGGYYALKAAVTHDRQNNGLACYVSYYPHMQDPNAPEPMQVYRYATEVDQLTIPVLVFLGEHEQYQRKRGAEMAINSLRSRDRDAQLVEYPGVGRGFDFRGSDVRTFADDLATKDAIQRATRFMKEHLQ
ncbi:MAG: dienelactone hydrolase family protein [Thioalkalivibrio sp.]